MLLGTASQLNPSGTGLGTHQQLGLPPCSTRVLFGIRCPACGMTTSWSYFMHGNWRLSLQSNIGGFLLAVSACIVIGVFSAAILRPGIELHRFTRPAAITAITIAAITITEWAVRVLGVL